MSDSRLLPTGSSPLEVAAARACAEIEKTPVSIRELWNPDTCPANLLPWLAWSFSVDRWDDKWPEATKRAVIRDAYFIHCHKGTIGAIRRVVEPLGYWKNSVLSTKSQTHLTRPPPELKPPRMAAVVIFRRPALMQVIRLISRSRHRLAALM